MMDERTALTAYLERDIMKEERKTIDHEDPRLNAQGKLDEIITLLKRILVELEYRNETR